jgi:hypothetical protein
MGPIIFKTKKNLDILLKNNLKNLTMFEHLQQL